jgi:putative endonuclease
MREFYLYILASRSRVLYIGVTNDLERRLRQHREGRASEFTRKYRVYRLVYAERYRYVRDAIAGRSRSRGGSAGGSSG